MSTKLSPQIRAEAEIKAQLGDTSAQEMLKPSKDGNSMPPPEFSLESSAGKRSKKGGNPQYPSINSDSEAWITPSNPTLYRQGQGDPHPVYYNDITQGNQANCYVMAAIAAVALTRPDLIQNLIKPLGNNMYEVTLYKKNIWGNYEAQTYQIEATFPNSGYYDGAPPSDNGEMWVMLLEKAFAVHYGYSYRSFDNGGNPVDPMSELMGSQAEASALFLGTSTEEIKSKILAAVQSGTPVVLGTPVFYPAPYRAEHAEQRGIIKGHAYTVLEANEYTLKLYNPQGQFSAEGKGPEITIVWEDIKRFFSRLVVGQ